MPVVLKSYIRRHWFAYILSVSGNISPQIYLTGRSYDGFYNYKFVAHFFYCVADIDALASIKRQSVTVQQGDAGATFRGGPCIYGYSLPAARDRQITGIGLEFNRHHQRAYIHFYLNPVDTGLQTTYEVYTYEQIDQSNCHCEPAGAFG